MFSVWSIVMLRTFLYLFPSTHMQEIFEAIKLRVKVYVQAVSVLSDKAKHFSKMIELVSQEANILTKGRHKIKKIHTFSCLKLLVVFLLSLRPKTPL